MIPPRTTDKMIQSLALEKWKAENEEVCKEFEIAAKIVYKNVSLDTIEALVHDALLYREICQENFE